MILCVSLSSLLETSSVGTERGNAWFTFSTGKYAAGLLLDFASVCVCMCVLVRACVCICMCVWLAVFPCSICPPSWSASVSQPATDLLASFQPLCVCVSSICVCVHHMCVYACWGMFLCLCLSVSRVYVINSLASLAFHRVLCLRSLCRVWTSVCLHVCVCV